MYRCYFIFEARSFDLKLGLDRIENRFKISFKRYALKEREREREKVAHMAVSTASITSISRLVTNSSPLPSKPYSGIVGIFQHGNKKW